MVRSMRRFWVGAAVILLSFFIDQVAGVLGLEWGITLASLAAIIGYGLLVTSGPVKAIWVWAAAGAWRRKVGPVLLAGLITGAAGSGLAAVFIWTANKNAAKVANQHPVPTPPVQQNLGHTPSGPASREHAQTIIAARPTAEQERSPRMPTEKETPSKSAASDRRRATVIQKGQTNISQIGDNNQATVIERPRLSLDDSQMNRISAALRPFAGKAVSVFVNHPNDQTRAFAERLVQAVRASGVVIDNSSPVDPEFKGDFVQIDIMGSMPDGVSLMLDKDGTDDNLAEAIADVLISLGISPKPMRGSRSNRDRLIVYVTPLS
jgi:hypothetical protein